MVKMSQGTAQYKTVLVPCFAFTHCDAGVAHKPKRRLEHLSMSVCICTDIIYSERKIWPSSKKWCMTSAVPSVYCIPYHHLDSMAVDQLY